MPTLSHFDIDDTYVKKYRYELSLYWETECAPESENTSYIIKYSFNKISSISELNQTESREENRMVLTSPNTPIRFMIEYEYHMTVAVMRGTEMGPPSKQLSFFYTEIFPEVDIKVENVRTNQVTLTFHPKNMLAHIRERYLIYKTGIFKDPYEEKFSKNFTKFEGLQSNSTYTITYSVCYEMGSNFNCNEHNYMSIRTDMDPPGAVNLFKEYPKTDVIEWKPPIQNVLDYYEVKLQKSDRSDTIVQLTGTKCTLVSTACDTGTNIYSVRAVGIQTDSQRQLQPRSHNYAPVLCKEEISSIEPTDEDREHVVGAWLQVRKIDCPVTSIIVTITIYVFLVIMSMLPISVLMARKKYKKMNEISAELPEGLFMEDEVLHITENVMNFNQFCPKNTNSNLSLQFLKQPKYVPWSKSSPSSMPDVADNDSLEFPTTSEVTLINPSTLRPSNLAYTSVISVTVVSTMKRS